MYLMIDDMKIRSIDIHGFAVFFYIVAMYTLERAETVMLYETSQMLLMAVTLFVVISRQYIVANAYVLWQVFILFFIYGVGFIILFSGGTMQDDVGNVLRNAVMLLCMVQYFNNTKNREKTISYILIAGLIASAFVIYEYVNLGTFDYNLKYSTQYRLGEDLIGGNVNITAIYLCLSFSAGIYLIFKEKRPLKNQVIYIIIAVILMFAMILTGSRKILIFTSIVFFMQALNNNRKKIFIVLLVFAAVYYCFINIDILYFYIGHKIDVFGGTMSLYEESDQGRNILRNSAFSLFLNNPFFGVGIGGVETYLGVYSHNNFVEIMASLGFIGFISYYSIYVYTLVELRKTQITKELRMFFISTIIALLVIEWFQVTYSYKAPMLMLALAASSILPKNNYDNIVENKL